MYKVKIHPLFIVYSIVLVLQNKYVYLLSSLSCIALHEWAHAKVAYNHGYFLDTINLMPYGAMISGSDLFTEKDSFKIAIAGPLSNIILCIILLASWWILPVSYNYTKTFFDASITLAFFNMLPFFPLDGSKILLSISKHPQRTLQILKGMSYTLSGLLFVLFLISFFYVPNINIALIGAILYISTTNSSETERYKQICQSCPYIKRLDVPIKKATLIVHQNLKIIRLLKHINAETETTFEIVDDNLVKIKTFNESEIKKIATTSNLHTPIKEFLYL